MRPCSQDLKFWAVFSRMGKRVIIGKTAGLLLMGFGFGVAAVDPER